MPGPEHRIRRAVFEIAVDDEASAFRARKRLETTFHESIVGALEQAFDTYAHNGEVHRIERLEIDLGILDLERIDGYQIRQIVLRQLDQQFPRLKLLQVPPVPRSVSAIDALIRFLETGIMQWDAPARSVVELEGQILESSDDLKAALSARLADVFRHSTARIRFAHQFSPSFFRWIVALLRAEADEMVERVLTDLGYDLLQPRWRAVALEAVIVALDGLNDLFEVEVIFQIMEKYFDLSDPTSPAGDVEEADMSPLELVRSPSLPPKEEARDALYTVNAGIVLLHPFLERFFKTVGLLNDGKSFRSRDAQARAIHLLHFLATGCENPEEHELLLEKVLCGYPLEAPISKELELIPSEHDEVESLLLSVIGHWSTLKNTSPDGLREGFLKREGRLQQLDAGWELTVEQMPHDVLLESLPWGLDMIKLAWMPTALRVNWA